MFKLFDDTALGTERLTSFLIRVLNALICWPLQEIPYSDHAYFHKLGMANVGRSNL
jgi:hypothetical protein